MIANRKVRIWQNNVYPDDVEEIIYSGITGNQIRLKHKEIFRKGHPVNSPSEEYIYDLSKSRMIVFRNYNIRVIDATNSSITYEVIKD